MMKRLVLCLFWVSFSFAPYPAQIAAQGVKDIDWPLLTGLDYESGEISPSLSIIIDQTVNVSGFIVPLELGDYMDEVIEFALVPDPLSCLHIPPPPPNQMVYVRMNEPIPLDMDLRGVTVTGILSIAKPEIQSLLVGFEMVGVSAKEANIEFDEDSMPYHP